MANETPLTVVGNLTRDPELKFTTAGATVTTFTVASTPRTFDRRENQWRDAEPMYIDCVAWRHLAEHTADTLTKGTRIVATGRLRQSHWENEHGEKRSRYVLHLDDIGPSLQHATCTITKTHTGQGGRAAAADTGQAPTAAAAQDQPAGNDTTPPL